MDKKRERERSWMINYGLLALQEFTFLFSSFFLSDRFFGLG